MDYSYEIREQHSVIEKFKSEALYWDAIYRGADVTSKIHQRRRKVVLRMIEQISLPKNAHVLEIGAGAGLTTVELARLGHTVQAIDVVKEMLDLTRQHAAQAKVSNRVFPFIGDVHNLHFVENTFDLVLAIGVLPYLHLPAKAIREMARVARPGSYLIITSDNYWRLSYFLDPFKNPLLRPLRNFAMKILNLVRLHSRNVRPRGHATLVHMYSTKDLMALVSSAQLKGCRIVTVGFGPFTVFGKKILLGSAGVLLDEKLQQLAKRNFLGLGRAGSEQILLARKELPEETYTTAPHVGNLEFPLLVN